MEVVNALEVAVHNVFADDRGRYGPMNLRAVFESGMHPLAL